jgi:arylsulfatase A-like enzyme
MSTTKINHKLFKIMYSLTKKASLLILAFFALAIVFSSCGSTGKSKKAETESVEKQKPNIVFFIADDMERYMFNCLDEGRGKNLSPNIDKLVNEGVLMLGQHVSSSVCTPSRYSCLTGQYASRSTCKEFTDFTKKMGGQTVVQWNTYLVPGQTSIATLLKERGYVTGFYGKNHAVEAPGWKKLPLDTDPKDPEAVAVLKKDQEIIRESLKKCGFDYSGALYQDNPSYLGPEKLRYQNLDWITAEALKFLDKVDDEPFFLYYATTVPHGPSDAAHSWNGDRHVTAEGILDNVPNVLPPKETIPKRLIEAGLAKPGKKIPDAKANVLWIDDALGALIKKLEEKGKLDNTIIFFFNDHGQYAKGSIYEGGVSSPSIIWKQGGFKAKGVIDALVSNIDFAPTILEMAGGDPTKVKSFDGVSMLPLLDKKTDKIHESLYFEMGFSRGVLKDSLKYIALRFPKFAQDWDLKKRKEVLDKWNMFRKENKLRYHYTDPSKPFSHLMLIPGGGDAEYASTQRYKHYYDTDQLYDLRTDPLEQNNLYNDPKYKNDVVELKKVLTEYLYKLPGHFGEFKPSTDEK